MPVYQYQGKYYELADGLSNEQALAKIKAAVGGQPKEPSMPTFTGGEEYGITEDNVASGDIRPSGFGRGLQDPLTGLMQIGSKVFGNERLQQEIAQKEQQYQQERAARGEYGTEGMRVLGNIVSPLNIIPGAAAAKGAAAAGRGVFGQATAAGVAGGAVQPVSADPEALANFWTEKVKQLGEGAVFGLLAQSGISTGGKVFSFLKDLAAPLTEKGLKKALQDTLKKLAGKDLDKVLNAAKNAEEIVSGSKPTVAQALANTPEGAPVSAYLQQMAKTPEGAPVALAREAQQQTARQVVLGQQPGPMPAAGGALERTIAERQAVTAPMREEALSQANIAGQVAPRLEAEIAQRQAEAVKATQLGGMAQGRAAEQGVLAQRDLYPVPGFPRVASKYSPNIDRAAEAIDTAKAANNIAAQKKAEATFKQLQLQSLADEGFFPLKADPIVGALDKMLSNPKISVSDLKRQTLQAIRDKVAQFSNPKTGVIDSEVLYEVRKLIGDDVKKFAEATKTSDAKTLAGLESSLKGVMDEAIENAGGTGWKKYLSNYATYSKKADQIRIGNYLADKLGGSVDAAQRFGAYHQALKDEAAKTITRRSGAQRYENLKQVLTTEQMAVAEAVDADIQRAAQSIVQGRKVRLEGGRTVDTADLPPLLSRVATLSKSILDSLKQNATGKLNRMVAELGTDPEAFVKFMEYTPKSKVREFISTIYPRLTPENQRLIQRVAGIEAVTEMKAQSEPLRIQMETGPGAEQ